MRWKQSAAINQRNFDDVIVLVDTNQAILHELNQVGSRIWSLCDGDHHTTQIATTLSEEFDISATEAQEDLHQFVQRLSRMGLLECLGE